VLHWPWRAALFKTLVKNDGSFRKLGVHRPRAQVAEQQAGQRWYDGSGRILPAAFHRGRIFSDLGRDNHAMVQLNHYALGAAQSFLLKRDRGRAVHEDTGLDVGYWVERNFDAEEDRSILKLDSRGLRATLLIGGDGRVLKRWKVDRVKGHADEVLAAVDACLPSRGSISLVCARWLRAHWDQWDDAFHLLVLKHLALHLLAPSSVSDHALPIWTSLLREKVDQAPLGLVHTLRTMLADCDADALDALLDEH
jgi:hypothetical protein